MVDPTFSSGPRQPLSSWTLALAAAGANAVLCAGLATVLHTTRDDGPGLARDVSIASYPSTSDTPVPTTTSAPRTTRTATTTTTTTTTESDASAGYQRVSGPGGMTTVVPEGWNVVPASGPGAMQGNDPTVSTRFVRFGGSPASGGDMYAEHRDYVRTFAKNRAGFESLRLDSGTFHGSPAVDWSFEYQAAEGRRHVRSVYWRADGYEYFVYASSLATDWSETEDILDAMMKNATP